MTLATTPITGFLYAPDGTPLSNTPVTIRLTKPEIDDNVVVPEILTVNTDSTGRLTVDLWPNTRGTAGSQYRMTVKTFGMAGDKRLFDRLLTVPESATPIELAPLFDQDPPDTVSTGAALRAAQDAENFLALAEQAAQATADDLAQTQVLAGQAQTSATTAQSAAQIAVLAENNARNATQQALTSAENAAVSASAASISALSADQSRIAALASQTAAAQSATAAMTSETNARNSETDAELAASQAATSASQAATSASQAASDAAASAASAASVLQSEINAAQSAFQANDSAVLALSVADALDAAVANLQGSLLEFNNFDLGFVADTPAGTTLDLGFI